MKRLLRIEIGSEQPDEDFEHTITNLISTHLPFAAKNFPGHPINRVYRVVKGGYVTELLFEEMEDKHDRI